MEFIRVWLHFIFALGSFLVNCFAEKCVIPEMTLDDRVGFNCEWYLWQNSSSLWFLNPMLVFHHGSFMVGSRHLFFEGIKHHWQKRIVGNYPWQRRRLLLFSKYELIWKSKYSSISIIFFSVQRDSESIIEQRIFQTTLLLSNLIRINPKKNNEI